MTCPESSGYIPMEELLEDWFGEGVSRNRSYTTVWGRLLPTAAEQRREHLHSLHKYFLGSMCGQQVCLFTKSYHTCCSVKDKMHKAHTVLKYLWLRSWLVWPMLPPGRGEHCANQLQHRLRMFWTLSHEFIKQLKTSVVMRLWARYNHITYLKK